MKITFLAVAVGCIFLFASDGARAEYPERPIRVIVPVAPGTLTSVPPRVFGDAIEKVLKQPFIIENKPGAGQSIGYDFVARSAPDGYTLALATPALPNMAVFFKSPPIDPKKDLKMVSIIAEVGLVMATTPKAPFQDFTSMVSYAKANPGKINFGTTGADDPLLFTELIKQKFGLNMVHIPYRGTAEFVQAMLAGDLQIGWVAPGRVMDGSLKSLIVTGRERLPKLPAVPSSAEVGVEGINSQWFGLLVPAATPQPIVDKLYAAIKQVATTPEVVEPLTKASLKIVAMSPADSQALLVKQVDQAIEVARKAGIKPEM